MVDRKALRVRSLLCAALLGIASPFALPVAAARSAAPAATVPRINLAHLDHLYAETAVDGERVGVVHIYSEAPDFRFAIEPREGFTCVDDVARAIVLLSATPRPDARRLHQIEMLTKFVLRMQADNGYFHNFLWGNGRINREYRTSLAELNWWSLRALWGLEAALPHLPAATAARARSAADRLVANLTRDLPVGAAGTTRVAGIDVPTWLPLESGADAGSTALLGLLPHYARTRDPATRALIGRIGEGMLMMQAGDARRFPHGAHLSWRNQWHAWGNAQAYALLRAGKLLGRRDFIDSALREVDHFYPYLLRIGMRSGFTLQGAGDGFTARDAQRFPQIAYGISPMILAATEAWRQTGEERYRAIAGRLATWFTGANDARRPIYDPASGRVLDGINGKGSVNPNSGAESTIEGLFALTALHGTPLP
ncbi:hypothetical protein [Sphingomonas hankookensis]|uniref:Glycosyl hydrolase n=1 Tax=Sphingomonas hengshuiensis TaxID=1609977 RepID=A0A2W5BIV4_9SPHN|nr:MAG: hypothetical protein DI632_00545 [Sphingomonas hengshuiensis]